MYNDKLFLCLLIRDSPVTRTGQAHELIPDSLKKSYSVSLSISLITVY